MIKQFVKDLNKEREAYKYLYLNIPSLSVAKLTEEMFVDPDRELMKDER